MSKPAFTEVNKRQDERVKIRYKTKLYADGKLINACYIIDFSSHGLLIEPREQALVSVGAQVQMSLGFDTKSGRHNILLKGTIVRQLDDKYGIRLSNIDDIAIKILENLAKQKAKTQTVRERKRPELLQPFAQALKVFTNEMLESYIPRHIKQCDELLFENARQAKSDVFQSALFDGRELLNKNAKVIKAFLKQALATDINRLYLQDGAELDENPLLNQAESQDLEIMGGSQFDDWLMVRTAASRLESSYFQILYQLCTRINQLTVVSFDKKNMPLSAHVIMSLFLKNLRKLELNKDVERIIWEHIRTTLVDEIVYVYEKADKWLLNRNVLPNIFQTSAEKEEFYEPVDLEKIIKECSKTQATATQNDTSDSQTHINEDHVQTASDVNMSPEELALLAQAREQLKEHESQKVSQLEASMDEQSKLSLKNIWQLTQGWTRGTLAALRGNKENELSVDEILDYVDAQKTKIESFNSLTATVKSLMVQMQVKKALSKLDNELVGFVELFFSELQSDERLSEEIKPLINSLQVPAFKGLLQDNHMFHSESHPLSRLIENMSKIGTKNNGIFKKHHGRIRQSINDVLNAKGSNQLEVINETCQYLSNLVEQQNKVYHKNIRRVLDLCDGRNQLQKTQKKVENKLNTILSDHQVPKVLYTLLEAGWKNLLVLASINEHEKRNLSSYWLVVECLARLESSRGEGFKRKVLYDLIRDGLTKVHGGSARTAGLISEIDSLLDYLQGRGLPECTEVFIKASKVKITQDREISTAPTDLKNWLELVDGLRISDYVDFNMDDQIITGELVWMGDENEFLAFVNEQGMKVGDYTRVQLAEMMYYKKARINYDARKPFISTIKTRFSTIAGVAETAE